MVFNSFIFLVFFAIVFTLYWLIPKKWQWLLLLIASYYFYMSWKPAYAVLILLSTSVSYVSALAMERYPHRKKLFLILALLVNFGILFTFKYFNFFSYSVAGVLEMVNVSVALPEFRLLLPVGISFYTFQTVSYMIDVYRGREQAERHFGMFALFVSFFPQLVAGPIERSSHLLPQLYAPHEFEYDRTVSGLKLFGLGLFKKVVIADNLALIVDQVFNNLPEYKGLSLVLAVFFFSWQIYCDFSGYTDMARGVARMLGFDLMENFNSPYLATSVGNFWRRWHISLSTWFKDYLYIPLGGNRLGITRTVFNLIIVFVLCGLWHGAAWTFVLWGAVHGVIMGLERLAIHFNPIPVKIPKFISVLYTYTVVTASWVLFRAQSLEDAMYIYRNSVSGLRHFVSPNYIWATISQLFKTNVLEMSIILFCLVAIMGLEWLNQRGSLSRLINRQPAVLRWALYTSVIVLVIVLRNAEMTEFIYFQF